MQSMKQIIQNYRSGELELAEVPVPLCSGRYRSGQKRGFFG
jgi:hypothetical protein